ncbi:MAG: nucleotidyltransferase domain-containing protein [Candidatus Edwardsbacteria bacterium]
MPIKRTKIITLLRRIFKDYPEILAAYLFGSATETLYREGSDIDVAVLLDEKLNKLESFSLELKLGEEIERELKKKVDLVILNRVPLALLFQVIRGVLVFERNSTQRAIFEAKMLPQCYENERFFKMHAKALYQRARRGRLGILG